MSEQGEGGPMTDEEIEALPEAPPEIAALMERALESLMREVPLGAACPECGSTDTKHVSIGQPEGASHKTGGWTVVVPPGVFIAYCECSSCEHAWEAEQA